MSLGSDWVRPKEVRAQTSRCREKSFSDRRIRSAAARTVALFSKQHSITTWRRIHNAAGIINHLELI